MKVGDRVRYTRAASRNRGRTGTVTEISIYNRDHQVKVRWDDGRIYPDIPFIKNLEIISMHIDPTKPLETFNANDDREDVTFITVTSPDNHIMVGKGAHWIIFDRDGKYVRSSAGQGKALILRNKLVKSTMFVRVNAAMRNAEASLHRTDPGGSSVAVVELTLENGIVVDARLVRANINEFTATPGL